VKELLYYVFEVTKIVPHRQQSLTEAEGVVRRKLITGRSHGLFEAVADSSLRRWRAMTRCAQGYLASACEKAVTDDT
jgi:hypothetical protein